MTRFALLDFESRSRADLKAVGGRLYWDHPSSEALCAVTHYTDTGRTDLWLPGDPAPDLTGYTPVAHNATGFDRFAAYRTWGTPTDPALWLDSSELAKRLGLPGKLAALGNKDDDGSKFTKSLSSVRRPKWITPAEWRGLTRAEKRERGVLPELTPEKMARVVGYCYSDVQLMIDWWPRLCEAIGIDPGMSEVSAAINDRGVRFDADLARLMLYRDQEMCDAILAREAAALGKSPDEVRAIASSPAQFTAATGAPNAQAETIRGMLGASGPAGGLARVRAALASIVRGKLRAGLVCSSADGRIRDTHLYYGGHPGRWSGQKIQLQNLTRPAKEYEGWGDAEYDDLIAQLLERPAESKELDVLLRATICAEPGNALAAADWSGIEARVLAWCAHDTQELDNIRNDLDPYKVAASQVFAEPYEAIGKGEKRGVGKVVVLAAGYGGGAGAIETFAESMRVDLAAAGVTADEVVKAWRRAHAPIVRFWYALMNGFRSAFNGVDCEILDFRFTRGTGADDGHVIMWLPSGRPIVYRDVRESAEERRGQRGLVYHSREPKKNFIPDINGRRGAKIYGGLLAENAIQATCRCILARALRSCHNEKIPVVLHVHDEIVAEVPEAKGQETYDRMLEIMCDLPDWLRDRWNDRGDCPLSASGWVGRRFRK